MAGGSTIVLHRPNSLAASTVNHPTRVAMLSAIGWGSAAVTAATVVSSGPPSDIRLPVILFATAACWAIYRCDLTAMSPLSRLMLLLYALPFSACAGYLLQRDFLWWDTPQLAVLCSDEALNALMVWTGLTGLLGLTAGLRLAQAYFGNSAAQPRPPAIRRVLPSQIFFGLLGFAVFLAWLAAPAETILTTNYAAGQSASAAETMKFNAAYLLSATIMTGLMVDLQGESDRRRRRGKLLALSISAAYVIVVLQVLRGDRECTGLIIALAVLVLTDREDRLHWLQQKRQAFFRATALSIPLALVVICFLLLGFLRSEISKKNSEIRFREIAHTALTLNTWTAVLLTNMGLAIEQSDDSMELLYGQTYIDYVLSLPPGFVANAMDYDRPVDSGRDPRFWYVGLSIGGIHPAVVPYKNFGPLGPPIVLGLFGLVIGAVEACSRHHTMLRRICYAGLTATAFNWFWYGDMSVIRAALAVAIFVTVHLLTAVDYRRGERAFSS